MLDSVETIEEKMGGELKKPMGEQVIQITIENMRLTKIHTILLVNTAMATKVKKQLNLTRRLGRISQKCDI